MTLTDRQIRRMTEKRILHVEEVNMKTGVVSGRDTFGGQVQLSLHFAEPVVSIPAPGEMWVIERQGTDWFLEDKSTNSSIPHFPDRQTVSAAEELTKMQPGDTRVSTTGTFSLYAQEYVGPFVPEGGTLNQALVKRSDNDWDIEWIDLAEFPDVHNLPPGGVTHQALLKTTGTDFDANWYTIYEVPPGGTTGQVLTKVDGSDHNVEWTTIEFPPPPTFVRTLDAVLDGGGNPLTTGVKGDLIVDFNCTIGSWTLVSDVSGDIVINIWKSDFTSFPPTSGDSITVTNDPALIGSIKGHDSSLVGWTLDISAGDILRFNIESTSGSISRATLALELTT